MKPIRTILAALCLSETYSPGVFNCAVDLAVHYDADILAVNVINVKDVQVVSSVESMGYDVHAKDYSRDVKAERLEQIAGLIKKSGYPRERIRPMVRIGHAVEQLLDIIKEEEVDLVVIGTKGRSDIKHLLVGSVAEKVFRHSPVTVVSYRQGETV